MIWLGQSFDTRHRKQSFREILFGVDLPESGFTKYQTFPVIAGILLIACMIATVIFITFSS